MRIVIVGNGKVGNTLIEQLVKEDHDIVVIDSNAKTLQESLENHDIIGVYGNGANIQIQKDAGVGESDLLIAATSADEINLLCCIMAKKLGCRNTIARVRNPEYASQMEFLTSELGLSMTINPEYKAAREMFRLLQFPNFLKRDSLLGEELELIKLKVTEESPLNNIFVKDLKNTSKVKLLVCTVERQEQVHIPTGNFKFETGDEITVSAKKSDFSLIIKNLNIKNKEIKKVMIIGGGRISVYLAELLIKEGINVKILESDYDRCLVLAESLTDAMIIHGDGSRKNTLISEGIDKTHAVVALTNIDEENLVLSMFANHLGVPKVLTKVNRIEYGDLFLNYGIDSIVSPKLLVANEIIRFTRTISHSSGGKMQRMYKIAKSQAEAIEFLVEKDTRNLNENLNELNIKNGILISCIKRNSEFIIPSGTDKIKEGDSVVVIALADKKLSSLNDIFA